MGRGGGVGRGLGVGIALGVAVEIAVVVVPCAGVVTAQSKQAAIANIVARLIAPADKKLTAFLEFGSAPSGRAYPKLAIPWPDQFFRSHPGKLP
jgi:hypothetical protein